QTEPEIRVACVDLHRPPEQVRREIGHGDLAIGRGAQQGARDGVPDTAANERVAFDEDGEWNQRVAAQAVQERRGEPVRSIAAIHHRDQRAAIDDDDHGWSADRSAYISARYRSRFTDRSPVPSKTASKLRRR